MTMIYPRESDQRGSCSGQESESSMTQDLQVYYSVSSLDFDTRACVSDKCVGVEGIGVVPTDYNTGSHVTWITRS